MKPFHGRRGKPPASSYVPGTDLVQKADFTYLGAFTLPTGAIGGTGKSFAEGGGLAMPIGFDPNDGRLFVATNSPGYIGKVTIPALGSQTLSTPFGSLPAATTFANPTDVTEGTLTSDGYSGSDRDNGGIIVVGSDVYLNVYSVYDGSGEQAKSTWRHSVNLATGGHAGPYLISDGVHSAGYVSGAMCAIPSAWQSALGGDVASGQTGISIISRTSEGPGSFFSWTAAGFGNPTSANDLLWYQNPHFFKDELGTTYGYDDGKTRGAATPWEEADGIFWNGSHIMRGGGMLIHKRSLLIFCAMGAGTYAYGIGDWTNNPPNPPVTEQNGWTVSNASTTTDGTTPGKRVVVPNLDISGDLTGKAIWIEGESAPVQNAASNNCVRAGCAYLNNALKGNSGTPTAYVDVDVPFTNGLTGKTIHMGEPNVYDPWRDQSQGNHAYPYFFGAFAYDLNHLAAVQSGANPYDVVPYALWDLNASLPAFVSYYIPHFYGVAWDAANRIAYLALTGWNGSSGQPTICAYQLPA